MHFSRTLCRLASVTLCGVALLLGIRRSAASELVATAAPASVHADAPAAVLMRSNLLITRTVTATNVVPAGWIPPTSTQVNGLPIESIIVMPPEVIEHARLIYAHGQALGRNAHAFAKIGDSTIEYPYFFINFDNRKYNLGVYIKLQATIDYYSGYFARRSAASKVGQHAWTVMKPGWANDRKCSQTEGPVQCELRLINPSIALIRLGPNDASNVRLFEQNFRTLVEYLIDQGVVPILSTKADRQRGMTDINNLMRKLASEYQIPLWDLDRVMEGMPNRGLWIDGVHMSTFSSMDYTSPIAYQRGHAMQNLTGLMALDAVRRTVVEANR